MRSPRHPIFRRSIVALVITQLVMFTLVPVHDTTPSTDNGRARIERAHQAPGIPSHDPDTCPICQLHTVRLLRPTQTRVGPPVGAVQRPQDMATALPVARAPPTAHQTRAPPLRLA